MARKMYFLATDVTGHAGLWVTDGATTAEVGGFSNHGVAGAAAGLGPSELTVFGQKMIFNGTDNMAGANGDGLWLTDGTASGTTEVGGPNNGSTATIPGASVTGLAPYGFTVFGSKTLFFGQDSANFSALWVTDGTKAGTKELVGQSTGWVFNQAANFNPTNFVAFGNQVLFNGTDFGTGQRSVWVTDGTFAGTQEIGGSGNAAIQGSSDNFSESNAIALGSKVLFAASDASGQDSAALWVSDGNFLGQGTVELGGLGNQLIPGAYNSDLAANLGDGVKFGNRIFFKGGDSGGGFGLWATDGTLAGTTELGGAYDAGLSNPPINQSPAAGGLDPQDLTVNGQQLLFAGKDILGDYGLWATDGTVIGTVEIGGPGDQGLTGLPGGQVSPYGLDPRNIVSLGNGLAVFIGTDAANKASLWVTNGTTAGTQEIGLLPANAGVPGVSSGGLIPQEDMVGGDGIAYFTGENANSQFVLWQTDGTLQGTKPVAATDGDGPNQNAGNPSPNPYLHGSNMAMGPVPDPPSAAADLPQDLTNVAYQTTLDAQYDPIANQVYVINSLTSAIVATIALTGTALAGALVKLASDGAGGTQVSLIKFPSLQLKTGDRLISSINGQPYIGYRAHYIGNLLSEVDFFYQPTGQPYQFYEADCTGAGVAFETKYYYTGITGKTYTGYEADYDQGGHLEGVTYTGVTGAAYSSYKVNYNVSVYTGLQFTYTNTPAGATYSSYEVDYNSLNQYTGEKLFYTNVVGQAYTQQEIDLDASGKLSKVLLAGYKNVGYDRIEQDFNAGTYTGAKIFYDRVVGQAYGAEEIDVNASGAVTKIVVSGLTGTPVTGFQQDFQTNGTTSTLLDTIYTYGNLTGSQHYRYSLKYSQTGLQQLWTLYDTDGSHTMIGSAAFVTIDSIGNDTITVGGWFDLVNITEGCGHETLTDWSSYFNPANIGKLFSGNDLLYLPKADFASWSALSAAAKNVGSNLVITAANGDVIQINNFNTSLLATAFNAGNISLT